MAITFLTENISQMLLVFPVLSQGSMEFRQLTVSSLEQDFSSWRETKPLAIAHPRKLPLY
ncbi:MAG: hypothetical protein F6K31_16645 [Symploca sp. SIO2G7]|nr:hypothetical protein [Symploca sp. SIO2G7]